MSNNLKSKSRKKYTLKSVEAFANVSGDHNPIHLKEDFAKTTRFKKRIVHGMFVASQISSDIVNILIGPGAIYISQSLNFKKPVYIDDTIETSLEVVSIKNKVHTIMCKCKNQNNVLVLEGTAVILKE